MKQESLFPSALEVQIPRRPVWPPIGAAGVCIWCGLEENVGGKKERNGMLSDEEKAEFRKLLVEVATTEMRTMVTDAIGAAFAESQRLTGAQIADVQSTLVLMQGALESMVDQLDVIEDDLRSERHQLARVKRRVDDLEAR